MRSPFFVNLLTPEAWTCERLQYLLPEFWRKSQD